MSSKYYNRIAVIRRALAPQRVYGKLLHKHPVIGPVTVETGRYGLATEGPRIIEASTAPCGIVFNDDSFLAIYELWHKSEDRLREYSYHYQRPGLFIRYDMEEKAKGRLPRNHVQTTGLGKIHAPCGGKVSIEQVLDMITGQFL